MSTPAPSQRLGPYELIELIGEGGMGKVWRARDPRLGRDVAIKISAQQFSDRFEREARAIAALNHPNICTLFDVGPNYLVMEYVEGEDLKGPVPLNRALEIAGQIAAALEAAHEKGIVHRDLKPGNIKIKPDGSVKVLDFGLAKSAVESAQVTPDSPTLLSGTGMILGTAGYMSPEQAKGKEVDKRADIFAFGVVLYELITGQRPFRGETVSEILAAVIKEEPDLTNAPAKVRRLLRKCLEKDPRKRLRDIGDWDQPLDDRTVTVPSQSRLGWVAAGTLAIVGLLLGVGLWRATRPVDHPLTRLNLDLGPDAVAGLNTTVAISPDGRRIVYPVREADGKQLLATRLLDQAVPTLLAGTENGFDAFFSPDSQWIGFFAAGLLRKISVQGGAPLTLLPGATNPRGASWGDGGRIVATLNNLVPLSLLPAAGGPAKPITRLAIGQQTHRWPQVLPGGEAVLFTASITNIGNDNSDIDVVSLKTGQVKVVQRGGYYGRYVPGGYLLYVQQGALYGVAFDPARLETRGSPVPLLDDLAADTVNGGGQFDVSRTGTLVYLAGKGTPQTWRAAWLDSSGKPQPLSLSAGQFEVTRISPDGRKLSFQNVGDIYVYDLEKKTPTRLTFSGGAAGAVWAPDGQHIVFQTKSALFWIRSDGGGEPQRLLERQAPVIPWSFSPDGKRLAFFEVNPETLADIWTLPLDLSDPDHPNPGKPELFLRTPADERVATFSPDGRWIAYRSDESGTPQIYVRPFPAAGGGRWQISAGGGARFPIWSKNGRELFYETFDNRIMVVDYTVSGNSFAPGKPKLWSDVQLLYPGSVNLDLAPDGKRFIVLTTPESAGGGKNAVHVTMLQNFLDELKRRIP
jgi:serine/threonine-protein kinase